QIESTAFSAGAGPQPAEEGTDHRAGVAVRSSPSVDYRSSELRVRNGDVEIHLVDAGPEDGSPILLCHGFPELAYSWRHQISALATSGHRVLAVDHRGVGRSSQPHDVEAYDIHHHVSDLVAVLDEVGVDNAFVVSHDWGTVFADAL